MYIVYLLPFYELYIIIKLKLETASLRDRIQTINNLVIKYCKINVYFIKV